jgi:PPM family protein phosphatase
MIAAVSDRGSVRTANEDCVYFSQAVSSAGVKSALALVADGMGGAQGGGVASSMAAQAIRKSYPRFRGSNPKRLRLVLERANREIHRRGARDTALRGMGTTCVLLDLTLPFAWAAWVGDSRLYLIRNGQIFQMTEDHTVVREMVRRGALSPEVSWGHEERNVITRALGSRRSVDIAVWEQPFPVRLGDRFLLCTDGLHDLITANEILEISIGAVAERACRDLVCAAKLRGGYDNVSALIVDVGALPAPTASPLARSLASAQAAGRGVKQTRDLGEVAAPGESVEREFV